MCPAKAIHVGETEIQLDENCVRCGRCAAACPMGALWLPGFSVPDVPQENALPLCVDCWKVPGKLSPEESVRVPCLGGLSPGRIVELVAMAGARSLELFDRGWCSGCNAGGTPEHPVCASLDLARSLIGATGLETDRLPRLRNRYLPPDLMPTAIPEPATETRMSRRGFFSAFTARAVGAIDKVKPLAPGLEALRRRGFEREPLPSRERERLLRGLGLIGKPAGVTQPPKLFYRVEISDACNGQHLCASICPTGALGVFDQGNRAELMFDTRLCIGCNECHFICPSGALSVLPNSYDALPDHPVRLTSFGGNICPECGQAYIGKAGEDICPQCQKRHHLASSAFISLFGSGR
ncbi:MAG: 4Fe-4S binding protein [Nitrosomonadales bacterium]|nr:4Fe-4S binding protein [Nitrosomonadales bacterium]